MSIINRDLIKAINSGKCIAVVGSGPSIEMGLPTWRYLADLMIGKIDTNENKAEFQKCKYLLKDSKYPEIFSVCEGVLGKEVIIDTVRSLYDTDRTNGRSYNYLANWPFALYLTTNYDNCLLNHLVAHAVKALKKLNSKEDFSSLNALEKDIVFKIHGDADDYSSIVLTKEQYDEFVSSPERSYWREKIFAVLHMFPVLIIGYSVTDPDFKEQLERAKDLALNTNVFLITADMHHEQASDLNINSGVKVVTYKNFGANHHELLKLLKRYDPFIAKRRSQNIGSQEVPKEEIEIASSLLIFTRLVSTRTVSTCQLKAYMGLVVNELLKYDEGCAVSKNELMENSANLLFTRNLDVDVFNLAINRLFELSYISICDENLTLLATGRELCYTSFSRKHNIVSRFKQACMSYLRQNCQLISEDNINTIIEKVINGLVIAFRSRGIEIVRSLAGTSDIDLSSSTDMVDMINDQFNDLESPEVRAAAADLLIDVIMNPDDEVKEFLVLLSHGFFAYHALGLDKKSLNYRKELAKDTSWLVDSSILIPIIAKDCDNHDYAVDLLTRMRSCELRLYSTPKIVHEVTCHAMWMINNYGNCNYNSAELLALIIDSPGSKPNLFINGYVNWSNTQALPTISKYIDYCLPDTYGKRYEERIKAILEENFVSILDFRELPNYSDDYFDAIDKQADTIKRMREERGTIRGKDGGEHQSKTEAEVQVVCQKDRFYFLTSSTFLDASFPNEKKFVWNPDTMYKFLSTISSDLPDVNLLYQSMIQEYYYSGFDVMDKTAVREYFKEPVRQARLDIEEVKKMFEAEVRNPAIKEALERFESVDDLHKPFYARWITEYILRKKSKLIDYKEKGLDEKLAEVRISEKDKKDLERYRAKDAKKRTSPKSSSTSNKKKKKKKRRNKKKS